jgi:hypothetical protein
LSSTDYVPVFVSGANPSSGEVDLRWTISAPGASIRAGYHTVSLEWKFESQ